MRTITRRSADPPPADTRELFHFQPRTSDPELWRTTQPLVVRLRCQQHKGLIATWTAIHWLIVLYAASGRRAFGVREIAQEAGVGRNELAGPRGYIQRLVALGLLQIVGYEPIPGAHAPRPIYHIDLAELERQSLACVPDLLRERCLPPPPRPAPDPRQLALFDADDLPPGPASGQTAGALDPKSGQSQAEHARDRASTHANGTVLPSAGTQTGQVATRMPENGTGMFESVPELSRSRDVERMSERKNERASVVAHAPDSLSEIAAQAAQAVITLLRQQGTIGIQPPPAPSADIPTAPADEPDLPATPLLLWQGDREQLPARERHQLLMLINELNLSSGGYGAYWVGRAILTAERCLTERGQPLSLNYLRGMLRRWSREGSWGSDLEPNAAPAPDVALPPPSPPAPPTPDHPSVAAYRTTTGRVPNAVQAQQIAATVADLALWQRVLTDWQANGWQAGAVAKMLDRYAKEVGAPSAASAAPPSVGVIHTYPSLDLDQREHWIRRFHAATSPAEKRAVLARMAQEHPQ